jgi:tRNA nucleotidyltransferase/poly(A) polymerase
MLRAVRFAGNLNYEIEERTKQSIKNNCARIKKISAERVQEELTKILIREGAPRCFELMSDSGTLAQLLPEIARGLIEQFVQRAGVVLANAFADR